MWRGQSTDCTEFLLSQHTRSEITTTSRAGCTGPGIRALPRFFPCPGPSTMWGLSLHSQCQEWRRTRHKTFKIFGLDPSIETHKRLSVVPPRTKMFFSLSLSFLAYTKFLFFILFPPFSYSSYHCTSLLLS